jgi:hypothetical protein
MKITHLQITHLATSHAVANIQTSPSPSQSLSIATRGHSNSEASAEPTPVSMAQIHINALSAKMPEAQNNTQTYNLSSAICILLDAITPSTLAYRYAFALQQ